MISLLNLGCLCVLSHYVIALYFTVLCILHAEPLRMKLRAAVQTDPRKSGNKPSADRNINIERKYFSETIYRYYIC